jgi:hypothetical protein
LKKVRCGRTGFFTLHHGPYLELLNVVSEMSAACCGVGRSSGYFGAIRS